MGVLAVGVRELLPMFIGSSVIDGATMHSGCLGALSCDNVLYSSCSIGDGAREEAQDLEQRSWVVMGIGWFSFHLDALVRSLSCSRSALHWPCSALSWALNCAISLLASSRAFARMTTVWSRMR